MTTLTQTLSSPSPRIATPAPHAARAIGNLLARLDAWKAARKQARADRELWDLARTDARVMNELSCAITRYSDDV